MSHHHQRCRCCCCCCLWTHHHRPHCCLQRHVYPHNTHSFTCEPAFCHIIRFPRLTLFCYNQITTTDTAWTLGVTQPFGDPEPQLLQMFQYARKIECPPEAAASASLRAAASAACLLDLRRSIWGPVLACSSACLAARLLAWRASSSAVSPCNNACAAAGTCRGGRTTTA